MRQAACYQNLGNLESAANLFEKYAQVSKNNQDKMVGLKYLGIVRCELQDFEKSIQAFQQAEKCSDKDMSLYLHWIVPAQVIEDMEMTKHCADRVTALAGEGHW